MFTRKATVTTLALLLDFTHCIGRARAADSFLSDAIIRKDQVQTVLEHKLAKEPACKHIVCNRPVFADSSTDRRESTAHRANRDDHVRLREHRERQ